MRLPDAEHTSRPWRIHDVASDFRLEDVWGLPVPGGGPEDFARMIQFIARFDPSKSSSSAVRALFAIRWKVGGLLGWDDADTGIGGRVTTLRDRLPADLRQCPGPEFDALPFSSLYLLDDEFAAETANETMHGVMHLSLVPDGSGDVRGQMAVLVKPNGLFGQAYMAAIRPFRHLIVYPPLIEEVERSWRAAVAASPGAAGPTARGRGRSGCRG